MLGKDLYKVDVDFELNNERLRSLVFFYAPLIGEKSLLLYQYLVLRGSSYSYEEINGLLEKLNISIDSFEESVKDLNRFRLLRTLKQGSNHILVANAPLEMKEFIHDDILVREFILKTSGEYYHELISDMKEHSDYRGFEDVSDRLSADDLKNWTREDESYLERGNEEGYHFNTLFDMNHFLRDISTLMFPMKYRTPDNLKQIAVLADLYGISYDRMRNYVANAVNKSNGQFNLNQLRYSCMNARGEYRKTEPGKYDVPCQDYLMSLQDGKEVTEYDKKILYNLAFKYHLRNDVINVLLEHTLKNCDNRLIENYIYPIASDMHRNDVKDSGQALERLLSDHHSQKTDDSLPVYDSSRNRKLSDDEINDLLALRNKQ